MGLAVSVARRPALIDDDGQAASPGRAARPRIRLAGVAGGAFIVLSVWLPPLAVVALIVSPDVRLASQALNLILIGAPLILVAVVKWGLALRRRDHLRWLAWRRDFDWRIDFDLFGGVAKNADPAGRAAARWAHLEKALATYHNELKSGQAALPRAGVASVLGDVFSISLISISLTFALLVALTGSLDDFYYRGDVDAHAVRILAMTAVVNAIRSVSFSLIDLSANLDDAALIGAGVTPMTLDAVAWLHSLALTPIYAALLWSIVDTRSRNKRLQDPLAPDAMISVCRYFERLMAMLRPPAWFTALQRTLSVFGFKLKTPLAATWRTEDERSAFERLARQEWPQLLGRLSSAASERRVGAA